MVCLSEYEIWIIGSDNFYGCDSGKCMKFFFIKGELFWLIKVIDIFVVIVVIKNGDFMYVDNYGNIKIVEYN